MAHELAPGTMTAIFTRLAGKSQATGAAGLTQLALAIERQAKVDLARATHQYGTRTPARPGGPPALVSGTLRRSITHTRPVLGASGWECRVGVAAGFYPPYGGRRRTTSSRYGHALETGLRNGATYPFLRPAFEQAVRGAGATTIARWFAADWQTQ